MAPFCDCMVYWKGALHSTVKVSVAEPALPGSPALTCVDAVLFPQYGLMLPVTSIWTLLPVARRVVTGQQTPPSATAIAAALA
jgi:hypothetical protein